MTASAITVGVRVRPMNQRENSHNSQLIVGMEGNCTKLKIVKDGKTQFEKPKEYVYDYAFWTHNKPEQAQGEGKAAVVAAANGSADLAPLHEAMSAELKAELQEKASVWADQALVYQLMGRPILANVFDGYNACLFAYGQTGSGKTYSMMGIKSDAGVLPRLGTELFAHVANRRETKKIVTTVECSFCEIYNDEVRDLMVPHGKGGRDEKQNLQIRQDPKKGIFVQGLSRVNITNADDFHKFLDQGLSSRAVGSTAMNNTSSRSHAIVLVTVSQADFDQNQKQGKMSLVDLAGSERSKSTGATGSTAAEGQNINLSLTALGMCLARLADAAEGKGSLHVPYRDSSLTYLLSENLGGNSKTTMLANISPADLNYEETLSTLRFAAVTKKVKTVAKVNESAEARQIRELTLQLNEMRKQLQMRKDSASVSMASTLRASTTASLTATSRGASMKMKHADPNNGNPPSPKFVMATPPDSPSGGGRKYNNTRSSGMTDYSDYTDESECSPRSPRDTHSPEPTPTKGTPFKLALGGVFSGKKEGQGRDDGDQLPSPRSSIQRLRFDSVPRADSDGDASQEDDDDDDGPVVALSSPNNQVFVDWRNPQLINLTPDRGQTALHYSVWEGDNHFLIADHNVNINFDGLQKEVHIRGEEVYINGELLLDEGDLLRHQDRLMIGMYAFRFSYQEGLVSGNDFDKSPKSFEHLAALEKLERNVVVNLRAKDAMAISRAFFNGLAQIESGGSQGVDLNQGSSMQDAAEAGMSKFVSTTPRTSNPVVRHISEDISMTNLIIFRCETDLAMDFPLAAVVKEEEEGDTEGIGVVNASFGQVTYEKVVQEQKVTLQAKEEAINRLRQQLKSQRLAAARHDEELQQQVKQKKMEEAQHTDHTDDEDQDSAQGDDFAASSMETEKLEIENEQQQFEELCLNRTLKLEMSYHSQVKTSRQFRVGGPAEEVDRAQWKKIFDNPPFFSDPQLILEPDRIAMVELQEKKHPDTWHSRCIACSKQWLYAFRRNDGRERVQVSLYLIGCQVIPSFDHQKGKHSLELLPSCPQNSGDRQSIASNDSALILAFSNEIEAVAWKRFFENAAAPKMPLSLMKRMIRRRYEEDKRLGRGDLAYAEISMVDYASRNQLGGPTAGGPHEPRAGGGSSSDPTKRASWKPDSEQLACLGCKSKFGFFKRRHHCRKCGEIFCSSCLNKDKICDPCENTFIRRSSTMDGFVTVETAKENILVIPDDDFPNPHKLRQDFKVHIGDRGVPLTTFRVDHTSGRAHRWSGDDIENVERNGMDPTRIDVHVGGRQEALFFGSGLEREHCFESLVTIQGLQSYIAGVRDVAKTTELLVTSKVDGAESEVGEDQEPGAEGEGTEVDSLFMVSNNTAHEGTIWVGEEDGRSIPFHRRHLLYGFVGFEETWRVANLSTLRMSIAAKVPIPGSKASLYVVCTSDFLPKISKVTSNNSRPRPNTALATVGLQILEDSILFAAVEETLPEPGSPQMLNRKRSFIGIGEEYETTTTNTLDGVSLMMGIPIVDCLIQFDHVVVIGSAKPLTQFRPSSPKVQYRSPHSQVVQTSQNASVLQVPFTRHHLSKFAPHASSGRPCIQLKQCVVEKFINLRSPTSAAAGGPPANGSPLEVGHVVEGCQLWANFGFDRLPLSTGDTEQETKNKGNDFDLTSLILANTMPEFYSLRNVFLVVPGLGSAKIPVAQCASGTVTFTVDVYQDGTQTAEVQLSFKSSVVPF